MISCCNLAVDIVKILCAGEYFENAVNCSPRVKLMKLTAQLSFKAKLQKENNLATVNTLEGTMPSVILLQADGFSGHYKKKVP